MLITACSFDYTRSKDAPQVTTPFAQAIEQPEGVVLGAAVTKRLPFDHPMRSAGPPNVDHACCSETQIGDLEIIGHSLCENLVHGWWRDSRGLADAQKVGFGSSTDLQNLSRRQARPSDRTFGSVVPTCYDWSRHSGTAFGVGRLIQVAVGLARGAGALLTNRAGCSANARSSATCRAA